MILKQATELARQEAKAQGIPQAIVRLRRRFNGRRAYIPIESRWASGLDGVVVGEIRDKTSAVRAKYR